MALAEKGDMGALQAYTGQTGGTLNYLQVGCWCRHEQRTAAFALRQSVWLILQSVGSGQAGQNAFVGVQSHLESSNIVRLKPSFVCFGLSYSTRGPLVEHDRTKTHNERHPTHHVTTVQGALHHKSVLEHVSMLRPCLLCSVMTV